MALDPNIILGGGPGIDFVGSIDRGRTAAQLQIDRNNQNAFTAATRQHGAGAIQGDQAALNALAAYSPEMVQGIQGNALGMENTRLGMQQTQQNMSFQAEEMQMARDQAKAAAAQAAQQMTADQRAAELANGERVLAGLTQAQTAEQWDRMATQLGQPELVGAFEDRNIIFAMSEGAREALTAMADLAPKPVEWRPATAEEAAQFGARAGQINTTTGKFDAAPMSRNQTTSVDPATGMVTITESTGGGTGGPTVGQVYNPNEVANVITMIDEIASNPALDRVVGPLEGGGGNNVDDLGAASRLYYGGEGLGLIERIGQLQSNAWLSARQMLKGGGAITDYESRKAEAAVARLSRAKSEEEFRTALKDLRDAIVEGQAKIDAARGGGQAATFATPPVSNAGLPERTSPVAPSGNQASQPPAGIEPEVWRAMTPDERALFQ